MTASQNSPAARPFLLLIAGTLAAMLLAAVAVWRWGGPAAADPAAAAEWVRTHNAAVAALEAGDPASAEPLLAGLIAEAPAGSPVRAAAVRNRAVGAVLAVDPESGHAVPAAQRDIWRGRADAAVAAAAEAAPDDPAPWFLAARAAAANGDAVLQRGMLSRAAARAGSEGRPSDGGAWAPLAVYELTADLPGAADEAAAAITAARGAAPRNTWVLLNALSWAASPAAADGAFPPDFAQALAALRERLAPFAAGLAQRHGGAVATLLDEADAAAEAGNRAAAGRAAAGLLNVLRAEEVVRADRAAVRRTALDFLRPDLPAAFFADAGLSRTPAPAPIPVRFEPFAGPAAAPELEGVTALAVTNFDLLGRDELVLLVDGAVSRQGRGRDQAVVVLSRDGDGGWAETLRRRLPGGGFVGLAAADLDLDSDAAPPAAAGRGGPAVACHTADVDLVLWGPAGVLLWENRLNGDGSRTLLRRPAAATPRAPGGVTRVVAADLDQEGDLDLALLSVDGPRLWLNRGDFTFEDRTGRADLAAAPAAATDVLAADFDRDVDLDLLFAAPGPGDGGAPVALWENLRHGEFRAAAAPADSAGPLGFELLDADGNASWDLLTADGEAVRLHLSAAPAAGRVRWAPPRTVAELPATRLRLLDHDNDGREDLLAWGENGLSLLRSIAGPSAGGGWEDASDRLPDGADAVRAGDEFLPRDLDGDGDSDLAGLVGGRVVLWENRGGEANASLRVALLAEFDKDGTDPKRCNHRGLGSLLELRRGPVYQAAVVRDGVTHFGLGPPAASEEASGGATPAGEALRILWTNGIPEVIREPASGAVCHPQKLGGSCPYLYAWDGERFAFATDLCWAAPIGLQLAEGVFAPTRAWEHVKIDGAALKPRTTADGTFYELRVCCELWEAEYFDRVRLTCVDHPPGTHVFTNEKVGPPELVEPRLYATDALHAPAAARVRSGDAVATPGEGWRDALSTVTRRDENYLKPFEAKRTQGFTEPWELELDLAGAPREGAVLLLTGWVFPTDTGINVALSQNPAAGGPRPPVLLMETGSADGADGWTAVLPNAGFPGGKTKTIALPLPAFPSEHRKVRLRGTQELYWDRAAWCVPGGVETRSAVAPLASAELRYRGFSARSWPEAGHGPDRFDYQSVDSSPLWPPMTGPFTRYGDVAELLTAADDRQAVLASGDEMALRFAVPPLPEELEAAGWTRDFVLHSVGYDKDANLHTVLGQGVLPMPHAGMTRYPPPPDEPFPDTPALRTYLRDYQTRPADDRFWHAPRNAARAAGEEPTR